MFAKKLLGIANILPKGFMVRCSASGARSLQPLAYDELEHWESAISYQHFYDLQDLLYAFLSLWGAPPLPAFAPTPDGLGLTLLHGIHRWPEDLEGYFHIDRAPFLHHLRFLALES